MFFRIQATPKNAYHQFFKKTQSFCCVQAFFVPQKCMSILEVFLEGKKCTLASPENCGYVFFSLCLALVACFGAKL